MYMPERLFLKRNNLFFLLIDDTSVTGIYPDISGGLG